ncbi:hypothetical protein C2S52_014533 [Perilla frutescens var. hirtella]|nr:hypothetical protein C2S52_014533 [Perilla frutescens var. hirtella]
MEVAEFDESFFLFEMPTLLDEHFIWGYILSVLFEANEPVSPEFEEAGKKIAKNCRGLRLVLARVMTILRKHEKTTERSY